MRIRLRYYGVDGGTTGSIPVRWSRFLYYGVEHVTAESVPESIPVLRDGFGCCRIVYDMTEPINGRKIRVAKISFGVMKKRNDNLVMNTKHKKGVVSDLLDS